MLSKLSIKVRALLNVDDIEKQIRSASGKIKERLELKLKISADDLQLVERQAREVSERVRKAAKQKDSLFINEKVEQQAFNDITKRMREVKKEIDELAKVELRFNVDKEGKQHLSSAELEYYNRELGKTFRETMRWADAQELVNGKMQKVSQFRTVATKAIDDQAKAENVVNKALELQADLLQKLEIIKVRYKGQYSKNELEILKHGISDIEATTPGATEQLKSFTSQVQMLEETSKRSGGVISRSLQDMLKFLRFYLLGGTFVKVLNAFKDGIRFVSDFDQSLVQLNRVAKVTDERLQDITKSAFEMAKGLARTGKEVIDAAAEWKRSGYTIEESVMLAGKSLQLANVADGISDVKEASSSLISILRGFKLEAKDVGNVMDMLVKVSDAHAISTSDLTEMLKRNAGTLAQTGTQLKEVMGLQVAAFESLRSFETVSAGLNFITARLRGMTEEGEEIVGLIPKLQDAFEKYTDGAVSVIDKQNGGLHSTFEILSQLSEVYGDLNDEAKAFLNQEISGTRQAKVLVAIMENWKAVESSIREAENAVGAADDANRRFIDSVQGRMAIMKSTAQEMWANVISSDFLKFMIEVGTGLLKITDTLGFFNVAIAIATGALLILNKKFREFSLNVVTKAVIAFRGLAGEASATAVKIAGTTISIEAFSAALTFGLSIAIPAIITGLNYLNKAAERNAEKIRKLHDEYVEHTNAMEELKEKYNDIYKRIEELHKLRSEGIITPAELDQLEHLEKVTEELRKQMEYELALAKLRGAEAEREAARTSGVWNSRSRFMPGMGDIPTSQMIDTSIEAIERIEKEINELEKSYDSGTIRVDKYEKQLLSLRKEMKIYVDLMEDIRLELEDEINLYQGFTDEGNKAKSVIEEQLDLIYSTADTVNRLSGENEGLEKTLNSLPNSQDPVVMGQAELNEMFKQGNERARDFYSAMKDLESIYNDVNEEEQISLSTLSSLITKYPEHIDLINKLNGGKEIGIGVTETLMEIEREQAIAFVENEKQKLFAVLSGLKEITKAYDSLMMTDPEAASLMTPPVSYDYIKGIRDQMAVLDEQIEYLRSYELKHIPKKPADETKQTVFGDPDIYRQLNIEIERLNILLDENQRLIDTTEGAEQEKHLETRIELINKQRQALENLNDEQKRQVERLRASIRALGFIFEGDDIINYTERLSRLTDDSAKNAEKLIKEFDQLTNKSIPDLNKQISELNETIATDAFEQYYDYLFFSMEEEIDLIKSQTDEFNKLTDAKIQGLQDQIKMLEEVNAQEREQEERAKRLRDIEKQKEKIANLEFEKVAMIQDGKWTYVADPRKVRQETERLQDLQEDYAKWEHDLLHKKQIDQLKQQIQFLEAEKKNYTNANNERIDEMNKFMDEQRSLIVGDNIFRIQSTQSLNEALANIDKEMYIERLNMLESFLDVYNKMMAGDSTASPSSFTISSAVSNIGNFLKSIPQGIFSPRLPMTTVTPAVAQSVVGAGETFNIYDFTVKTDNAMQLLTQLQMMARMR